MIATLDGGADRQRGANIAALLAGSWRPDATPTSPPTEQLARLADALLDSGQGALVWRRLCLGNSRPGTSTRKFRDAYRTQTMAAIAQAESLGRLFALLRVFNMSPILIKGWASAQAYAEPGLRPFGDIDLCVAPEQLPEIQRLLDRYPRLGPFDLHSGVPDLPDRSWEQLYARSRMVPLGQAAVRILGAEDHLRLVALHQIRHGFSRPLWLCDVAAALETRPADFDWAYFLSGDERLVDWVLTVIGLACRLLDARLGHPPLEAKVKDLPAWLVDTALWCWGRGWQRVPLASCPRRWLAGLYYEKLNPIKATFRLGVRPRGRLPLLAVQLMAAFVARVVVLPEKLRMHYAKRQIGLPPSYATHRHRTF